MRCTVNGFAEVGVQAAPQLPLQQNKHARLFVKGIC